MANLKTLLSTIEELVEQGYTAEYIAGYTGQPVEYIRGFVYSVLEGKDIYEGS